MRFMILVASVTVLQSAVAADPADIAVAANASFSNMPEVVVVDQIAGRCGADQTVNPRVAYCTTANQIMLARDAMENPAVDYLLAHAFGHAVQVQHGVADVALRTIRNNRSRETELRGYVARQVDCIAGVLVSRAGGGGMTLHQMFATDPFADPHWGRHPLFSGPEMGIGIQARSDWFRIGMTGDLSRCGAGIFPADLLLEADEWGQ